LRLVYFSKKTWKFGELNTISMNLQIFEKDFVLKKERIEFEENLFDFICF